MSARKADPTLVRQRHLARARRLKRRLTTASVLGFVALFGLAAQHVVRSASASTRQLDPTTTRAAASRHTTYFDQHDGGFSFADEATALPSAVPQAPQPMAQTSVS